MAHLSTAEFSEVRSFRLGTARDEVRDLSQNRDEHLSGAAFEESRASSLQVSIVKGEDPLKQRENQALKDECLAVMA